MTGLFFRGNTMAKQKSAVLQAKSAFMELYHEGEFDENGKIPSELVMAKMLGVSRETWRKALGLLRGEGILVSKHGSGTYLLGHSQKINNDLAQLRSITKMIQDSGIHELGSHSDCFLSEGSPEICHFFQADERELFFVLRKVRMSDQGCICASESYMPQQYAKMLKWSNPPASLFSYLEKEYAIFVTRALTELFIPDSRDPLYRMLRLKQGVHALGLKQYHFDNRGNPVIFSTDYLRDDLFNFTVMRTRP